MLNRPIQGAIVGIALQLVASGAAGESLRHALGRNEVRVWSAPLTPPIGVTVADLRLAERLERIGYRRVRQLPDTPGQYFWGFDNFWIYHRSHRGRPATLAGFALERPTGTIVGYRRTAAGKLSTRPRDAVALESELLANSLTERRAIPRWVTLDELPETVWRSLLAIEDARFFEHRGVDGRAVARALLANVRSGKVVQGGSTITQQLIKLRDLTPKRTLGRKASEALRALALEAEHTKEEILEGYLNSVYYGHVDGVALYGIEAAAQAFYSRPAADLDLSRSAALAAMVQGPNRLSPLRSPERLLPRYRRVLDRLVELDWASQSAVAEAHSRLPPVRGGRVESSGARHYLRWLAADLGLSDGEGGVAIEASVDAELQRAAEAAVARGLATLRRRRPSLRSRPLSAALVALDGTTGEVLAYVGGEPAAGDDFDRVRSSRRQPGSTVKPFVALEALDSCGSESALFPSRRVRDAPLTVDLPSGEWSPQNVDRRFRGTVTVRDALARSLNVPLVRVARHCGFDAVASRMRRAGIDLPVDVQPAFVLGAIETSPLDLATAYSTFVNDGDIRRPKPIRRAWKPNGRRLLLGGHGSRHVGSAASSYMVRELLRRDDLGLPAFGKTGTSSAERDAWYAGGAGRVVTTVWVGLDDDRPLGFSGAEAAEPIWEEFIRVAAPVRGSDLPRRPKTVVEHWVDPASGLRLSGPRADAESFLFRRRARPPMRRLWRRTSPLAPID